MEYQSHMSITDYGFEGLLERNEERTPHDAFSIIHHPPPNHECNINAAGVDVSGRSWG
jgi:hypothetical protein